MVVCGAVLYSRPEKGKVHITASTEVVVGRFQRTLAWEQEDGRARLAAVRGRDVKVEDGRNRLGNFSKV